MDKVWIIIQIIFSKIDGWLRWFLGGYDGALCALVVFVVIDCITAIMCAIVDKKMSRTLGLKGIFKKVLIFVLVGVGHILDTCIIDATPFCVPPSFSSIFPVRAFQFSRMQVISAYLFRKN